MPSPDECWWCQRHWRFIENPSADPLRQVGDTANVEQVGGTGWKIGLDLFAALPRELHPPLPFLLHTAIHLDAVVDLIEVRLVDGGTVIEERAGLGRVSTNLLRGPRGD
jgi:hypothetical protein